MMVKEEDGVFLSWVYHKLKYLLNSISTTVKP